MDTAGNPVPNRLGTGFPSLGNDIPEAREQDSRPTGRTLYVTGIKKEDVSDRKSDTSSFYESERPAFSADGACQGILRKSAYRHAGMRSPPILLLPFSFQKAFLLFPYQPHSLPCATQKEAESVRLEGEEPPKENPGERLRSSHDPDNCRRGCRSGSLHPH